jgi:tRNA-specific 2-thiouridylase
VKVLAAMSGGVDSAVAAARAVAAGHEVTGVHMALMRRRAASRAGSRGCCSVEDASDAARASGILGIPFYVWDLSEDFEQLVVADFLGSYEAGRTPNPCVRCNEHIKFATLADRAEALGFDAVCTGHYARVGTGPDGSVELRRAREAAKDQSYVLAVAGPERLRRALFPLGEVGSKADVRAEAEARGLPVAAKPDSYDICFVADGDTAGFLRARLGEREGEIVDQSGAVIGRHRGAYAFTVGQRRGLALGDPAPDGRPRYVTRVDVAANRVHVGPAEALDAGGFAADGAVWFGGGPPAGGFECAAQIRAHGAALEAWAVPDRSGTGFRVRLASPARGLAAGQSAVLYTGDRVLAQGTIAGPA